MANTKKQMKITKMFRKGGIQVPEDCDDLQEEIKQLQQKLKDKHDELFELQRNSHKQRYTDDYTSSASSGDRKSKHFIRPEKIALLNSVEYIKRNIELMSLLSGIEVQSYEADDHCAVVYHMQHESEYQLKHGLRIEMKSGTNSVSASSLPLGFNLNGVLENYGNVMTSECLVAVRNALVAYYDRLYQYHCLKKLLKLQVQLFKTLDGSHVEITFAVCSELEAPDEQIGVTLVLDYRVHDIRPKQCAFLDNEDIPSGTLEALLEQCLIFKREPLHKAFKGAFIDGVGPYVLVQQVIVESFPRRRKQKRARAAPYNVNDDTFHPEDCSSEDDIDQE